jgi:hypothetical protein
MPPINRLKIAMGSGRFYKYPVPDGIQNAPDLSNISLFI